MRYVLRFMAANLGEMLLTLLAGIGVGAVAAVAHANDVPDWWIQLGGSSMIGLAWALILSRRGEI